jgi:hypothetical protein
MLQGLLAGGSVSPEAAQLLKLGFKAFWSASYMEIPAPLAEPTMFAGWMTALHTFITQPVPEVCHWRNDHAVIVGYTSQLVEGSTACQGRKVKTTLDNCREFHPNSNVAACRRLRLCLQGQPEDLEARRQWPWWKAMKWALHISHRLFNRWPASHRLYLQPSVASCTQGHQGPALQLPHAGTKRSPTCHNPANFLLLASVTAMSVVSEVVCQVWRPKEDGRRQPGSGVCDAVPGPMLRQVPGGARRRAGPLCRGA